MIQVLVGATVPERDITEVISGLSYSSANPGGFASCNFTVPGRALYRYVNQLRTDAKVWVKCGPKTVWEGVIVNDPEAVKFGDSEDVAVECGGNLEVAKRRKDYCKTWVDASYDIWTQTKDYTNWSVTIDGSVDLRCEDGTDAIGGTACSARYWIDSGFAADDIAFVTFDADYDLGTHMTCEVQYTTHPWDSWSDSDWTKTNLDETLADQRAPSAGSFAAGTKAIRFKLGCDTDTTVTDDRFFVASSVHVFSSAYGTGYLSAAMADVADDIASTTSVAGVVYAGTLAIRPFSTRAEALDYLASLHSAPLDWGFWDDDSFAVAERATAPALIDHLIVDASDSGVDWQVERISEDACEAVAVMYQVSGHASYPDGTVVTTYRASAPAAADARVHVLDYTEQLLTPTEAAAVGDQYLDYMSTAQYAGTVTVVGSAKRLDGVPVRACEMRAGQWVENLDEFGHAPRFISLCDYDRDSDTATLTVGDARKEFQYMKPRVVTPKYKPKPYR